MSTTTNSTITSTYRVAGMTCGHCARAITGEISALAGVCEVSVDLPTGAVTVCSQRELTRDEVAAAVDEAGYQLAS
jgi:copper chaperone CopZ